MKRSTQGAMEIESPQAFAHRLNLQFTRISLLTRALTHRSFLNEHPDETLEDNERLEFLGDAVLDFLVGAWLYKRFPELREGDLTRLRSALVCTEQLAEFANQLHFGNALRLGRGEGEGGGRQRRALLCATFEAVVGALYLDSGLEAVSRFIEPLLADAVNEILITNSDQDPKSLLQERVQAMGFGPPVYQTVLTSGPEHMKSFEVEVKIGGCIYGRGEGPSKQAAAKAAARAALERIEQEEIEAPAALPKPPGADGLSQNSPN
jgi:ribonuclease-3